MFLDRLCCRLLAILESSTYYLDGKPVQQSDRPVSEEYASQLLENLLITRFRPAINKLVEMPLNINQKHAIESLVYNIGVGAFKRSSLLRKLNKGHYNGCAKEFMSWIYVKSRLNKGLIKRRTEELILFMTPSYKSENKTVVKEKKRFNIIKAILALFKGG